MKFYIYKITNELARQIIVLSVLVITIITVSGCNKLVDIDSPAGKLIGADAFNSDSTANSSVLGIYNKLMSGSVNFASGYITIYSSMLADELNYTGTDGAITEFQTNSLLKTNPNIGNEWDGAYSTIYQANACIEGITASTTITPSVKSQLLGESKLVRALCYFNLVNLFGDVPLILTTDYRVNARAPRTAKSLVYEQVLKDLNDAKNLLTPAYFKTGKIRPNRWTASALLARVNLYLGKYAEAESEANDVIGSGVYQLGTDLSKVFQAASNEIIWQINPVLPNTKEGLEFLPATSTTIPTYVFRDDLLTDFSIGDKRKAEWIKEVTIEGTPYSYPYKYRARATDAKSERYVVVRLAEVYLIRAEARAQQNKPDEAVADLNEVRTRARNTTLVGSVPALLLGQTKEQVLTAVENERRFELFAEWGHRWFDLKRTGRANAILAPKKGTAWSSTDQLYPIPEAQINLNNTLTQNDGYNN